MGFAQPKPDGNGLEPIPSATILGNALGSAALPQALPPSLARSLLDAPSTIDSAQTVGMLQLLLWDEPSDSWADVKAHANSNGLEFKGILIPHVDYLETIILDLLQASDLINRTTDPLVSGRLWHSSGTLRISQGPTPYVPSLDFSDPRNSMYL